ncbi:hypothetical protein KJ713_02830 [Patescibacteria group bacterium]|nr:hypothetical protein [Patescibacteria group bacterium]
MAANFLDDGRSVVALMVVERPAPDGCKHGTPSGDSDGSLDGLVETDSDVQGWSCGKDALALVHSATATCGNGC